jgi:glycerol-3-phosphate dehydrogenase (NAD(P)+)
MKIAVIGAGAWGTALGRLLVLGGNEVTLWGHVPAWLDEMRQTHRNERFLPGIDLPRALHLESDFDRAVRSTECVVAVPSQVFRDVTRRLGDYSGLVVTVTKGIEYDTGLTMSGVLTETAPQATPVALSGPTFAVEVARDIPTANVAGSRHAGAAQAVQALFQPFQFPRLYQPGRARR